MDSPISPPESHHLVPVRLAHVWRRRNGKVVVYSDAHFNLVRLELNPTASRIWELMDGRRSVSEIANQLREEYPGCTQEQLAAAVLDFFDQMRQEWLAMSREELETYE